MDTKTVNNANNITGDQFPCGYYKGDCKNMIKRLVPFRNPASHSVYGWCVRYNNFKSIEQFKTKEEAIAFCDNRKMLEEISFRALFIEELSKAIKEKKTLKIKKFFPEFRTTSIRELSEIFNQMVSECEQKLQMMGF